MITIESTLEKMMGCCDDPTEPTKINRSDLVQIEERYGNLQRELYTGDPEKVMLQELRHANAYIRELAALRAYYPSVRKQAISLLDGKSKSILEQVIAKEGESEIAAAAKNRLEQLAEGKGILGKLFNH